MKNRKQSAEQIQQAIERAIQALEELEAALYAGDHRKIGAKLYELRRALQDAKRDVQP